MAYHFNAYPDELEQFFEQPGCLQAFSRVIDRLQDDVAIRAIKIASCMIIAIARQIAGDTAPAS